jgi:hypothetical protein
MYNPATFAGCKETIMTDLNTLGLPAASAIIAADVIDIVQDVASLPEDRQATISQLADYLGRNGWLDANEAWTYVSPYTVSVASGAALRYAAGMKLKYFQGRHEPFTNDPAAGSNIELNMADTSEFTVGAVVTVVSSAGTEYARVTVVHNMTHITVDALALNHTLTTPMVWIGHMGWKYAYIASVADTVLTITGGADYVLTYITAIATPYFSIAGSPIDFPFLFRLTAPTWTTTINPFTNQPDNLLQSFRMIGKEVRVLLITGCNATSGGTGQFIATFTAGELPAWINSGCGPAMNFNTLVSGASLISSSYQNAIYVANYAGTTIATNSEDFTISIHYTVA